MTLICSVKVGIIGGSGLSDPDILLNKTVKSVDTPYGKVIRYVNYTN